MMSLRVVVIGDNVRVCFILQRSIQILTEQLISLMYRPNLLKMLLDGRPSDNGLVDLSAPIAATPELVSALNGCVEC